MKKYAIIVAGGSGRRMKSDTPKQFLVLNDEPILFHTLRKFHSFNDSIEIILALPEKDISFWKELCENNSFEIPHQIVIGGQTRFHTVKNAISLIKEECLIAVHDGVRPLVTSGTIEKCYNKAEQEGNAIPVINIAESIRETIPNGSKPVDRNKFFLVQTPQVFKSKILIEAYKQEFDESFTDDASVVEKCSIKINMVEGNKENIKITTPSDLKIAELLLKS